MRTNQNSIRQKYNDTALPTDSDTFTLLDTEELETQDVTSWVANIKHSQAGTVRGFFVDKVLGEIQFYDSGLLTIPLLTTQLKVDVAPFSHVRFKWINGGTTQTYFLVRQGLVGEQGFNAENSVERGYRRIQRCATLNAAGLDLEATGFKPASAFAVVAGTGSLILKTRTQSTVTIANAENLINVIQPVEVRSFLTGTDNSLVVMAYWY